MYEYQIVEIQSEGILGAKLPKNFQEILNQNAAEGWRLVQLFAPINSGQVPYYFQIILEKEIKEEKNKYWELP